MEDAPLGQPPPPRTEESGGWLDTAMYAALGLLVVWMLGTRFGLWSRVQTFYASLKAAPVALPRAPRLGKGREQGGTGNDAAYADAYNEAHTLAAARRWPEALTAVERACRIDTRALDPQTRAAATLLRARICSELKRWDAAIASAEQARALTPGVPVYEALTDIYFQKGDYRQAVNYGRDFLDAGGKVSPRIYYMLGASHDRLGDVEQASQWIHRGRIEFPEDEALAKLGERYDRQARSERGMATQADGRFVLKFADVREQAGLRDAALKALDRAYTRACAAYSFQPTEALPVILYASPSDYYTASGAPQWSAAQFDGKIRVPLASSTAQGIDAVVAHEMTHYVVHQIAGERVPAWLDEGLAQMAEGRDESWAQALVDRSPSAVPLAQLERSFADIRDPDQAKLAYAQALVSTRRLVDKVGMGRIRGILDQLAAGRRIDQLY